MQINEALGINLSHTTRNPSNQFVVVEADGFHYGQLVKTSRQHSFRLIVPKKVRHWRFVASSMADVIIPFNVFYRRSSRAKLVASVHEEAGMLLDEGWFTAMFKCTGDGKFRIILSAEYATPR